MTWRTFGAQGQKRGVTNDKRDCGAVVVLLSPLREKAEPSPSRGRVPRCVGTVQSGPLRLGGGNGCGAGGLAFRAA